MATVDFLPNLITFVVLMKNASFLLLIVFQCQLQYFIITNDERKMSVAAKFIPATNLKSSTTIRKTAKNNNHSLFVIINNKM